MNNQLITSATMPSERIENGNASVWTIGLMEGVDQRHEQCERGDAEHRRLTERAHAGQQGHHDACRDGHYQPTRDKTSHTSQ